MRADEALLAMLRPLLSAWSSYEPGARLGDDPEPLHDLRITARRIAATLGAFAPYVPSGLSRPRRKLKSLLRWLGAARDLDVQLAALDKFCLEFSEPERAAAAPLRRQLEVHRARARVRMRRALDAESTRKWLERLTSGSAHPASLPAARRKVMAVSVIPDLIGSRFRKVRKQSRRLNARSSLEQCHAVRGRVKKLRYLIEPMTALYGKPAAAMLRSLRRLQEQLGVPQDAYVIQEWLLALAANPATRLPAGTLLLMGRFAERQAAVAAAARRRIEKAARKIRGRRWRALRRRLDEVKRQGRAPQTTAVITGAAEVRRSLAIPSEPFPAADTGNSPTARSSAVVELSATG
jgi:CHAD domain-containing protein